MKDTNIPKGAGSGRVRDAMKRVARIERDETVDRALQKLEQEHVDVGLVDSPKGEPFGIVTQKQLLKADKGKELNALVRNRNVPAKTPVRPDDRLDEVTEKWGEQFGTRRTVKGMVVEEEGQVLGILSRDSFEKKRKKRPPLKETIETGISGGYPPDRLAGEIGSYPVDRLAGEIIADPVDHSPDNMVPEKHPPGTISPSLEPLYRCADCPRPPRCPNEQPEERRIGFYDWKHPPKCNQGHELKYVEDPK
ncbi:MAG TPA: CBS domain-containing protein [Ktedonobacteraceae bacterium]|nr:CBS domain-containing protein [Ktedonobacteraceae bacterium]